MMRRNLCRVFAILTVLCLNQIALAQVPTETPVKDPQPLIEVASTKISDKKIQDRISNIFDKIDSVQAVTVSVDAGVVTLSGDVANEAAAVDAMDIAIRTAGVVTVEDEINRTLAVKDNVAPFIQAVEDNGRKLVRAFPLMLLAFVIFLAFVLIGGWLARRQRLWNKVATNPFLGEILSQIVRLAFWTIGAVVALNLLGASGLVTTLLGGAGVMGIAIGFAVRDSLENYISSIMLSLRQPFRAKDHVVINDKEGIVVRLTSRATILMTLDGNHLRIPNATVFKGIILNYTTNPERRFEFELGVGANDDPIAAISVGVAALETHDFLLDEPEPYAVIKVVGDSNIVLQFYGWVDQRQTNFGKARSQAISTVTAVLEDKGFTLPEPIYRLRFDDGSKTAGLTEPKVADSVAEKAEKDTPLEEILDVSRDTHLEEKVNEERAQSGDSDLLDFSKPVE